MRVWILSVLSVITSLRIESQAREIGDVCVCVWILSVLSVLTSHRIESQAREIGDVCVCGY